MQFCDNFGFCRKCSDRWHEWNSCTDHVLYQAPNCSLYNAEDCTQQVSTTGVNVLGTQTVDIPVECPADSDGDGTFDQGGCSEVTTYSHGTNFMSLYELDPLTGDELIQTLFFPETLIHFSCDVWGCPPAGSAWVKPISYQDPAWPPKVYAEMAIAANFGVFVDSDLLCPVVLSSLATVSAASFVGPEVAADSIASTFGHTLAPTTEGATQVPLPTSLAGITVKLTDRSGMQQVAPLLFASPGQINFIVPAHIALGVTAISVEGVGEGLRARGNLQIGSVAPALFSANGDGRGVAAALGVRAAADGSQHFQFVFACGSTPGSCVPLPIELAGASEQVFLVLFGTGIRGHSNLTAVQASIGGFPADVTYAGPQGQFPGLDQVNMRLPSGLTASGEVDVVLTVDGHGANTLQVAVGPAN